MTDVDIQSALLAAHNLALCMGKIASALWAIALVLAVYPWLGGFGSSDNRKVKSFRDGNVTNDRP